MIKLLHSGHGFSFSLVLCHDVSSERFENGSGEDLLICLVCGKTALDLHPGEKMKVSACTGES
jgi:hypothetical protein